MDGDPDGVVDDEPLGDELGLALGSIDGEPEGGIEGEPEGDPLGLCDGVVDGVFVGDIDGDDGLVLGPEVGLALGLALG